MRVFTRECALGSFFDRASFLCVDPKNADCPTGNLSLTLPLYIAISNVVWFVSFNVLRLGVSDL